MRESKENQAEGIAEPLPRDADGITGNGRHSPLDGLTARVTQVQAEIGVQILNGDADNLRQIGYKFPEPIPRADPEGRGRSIGQRIDEAIAEAEQRAVRDYQKAAEEQRQ